MNDYTAETGKNISFQGSENDHISLGDHLCTVIDISQNDNARLNIQHLTGTKISLEKETSAIIVLKHIGCSFLCHRRRTS